jgi:hypothetical protein
MPWLAEMKEGEKKEEDEEEDEEDEEEGGGRRRRRGRGTRNTQRKEAAYRCSKLAAGTKQLNNTAFYTPLSSGGPASAMALRLGPKGRRAAVREQISTHDYIFNLPPRPATSD